MIDQRIQPQDATTMMYARNMKPEDAMKQTCARNNFLVLLRYASGSELYRRSYQQFQRIRPVRSNRRCPFSGSALICDFRVRSCSTSGSTSILTSSLSISSLYNPRSKHGSVASRSVRFRFSSRSLLMAVGVTRCRALNYLRVVSGH